MPSCEEDEFSLPPESALAREMYACFGSAVYFAQVYEKGLGNLIAFLLYHENKGRWSKARYVSEVDRLEKQTLGPLLKRVKKVVTYDQREKEKLDEAHKLRNFLIHDYFWVNSAKASFAEGQRNIIAEMASYRELFTEADQIVDTMTRKLCVAAGISDELIQQMMSKMIDTEKRRIQSQ